MAAVPTVPIARSLCHSVSPVRLRRAAGFPAHLELTWNRCVGRRCCCCCCVARLAEHCPNLVPSSAPCHWEPSSRVGCAAPTPARPLTATPNLKQVVVSLCAVGGSHRFLPNEATLSSQFHTLYVETCSGHPPPLLAAESDALLASLQPSLRAALTSCFSREPPIERSSF